MPPKTKRVICSFRLGILFGVLRKANAANSSGARHPVPLIREGTPMFNWIKRPKTSDKSSRRKAHRQDRSRQSSFRPRLEPLEERMLLYAGALDQTFGTHGIVIDSPLQGAQTPALALQADGKILLGGSFRSPITNEDFVLERFNADGSPDFSFGTGGRVQTDLASGSNDFANCIT